MLKGELETDYAPRVSHDRAKRLKAAIGRQRCKKTACPQSAVQGKRSFRDGEARPPVGFMIEVIKDCHGSRIVDPISQGLADLPNDPPRPSGPTLRTSEASHARQEARLKERLRL